jgi:GNAT superfamily N-acetyltransferase
MSREDQLADRWSAEPTAATRPCALKVAGEVDVAPTIAQLSGHMDERQRRAFRDKLERYVRKPDRDLIVAVSGGDILGFLAVIEEAFPPEPLSLSVAARLRPLASCAGLLVHSRHRRQGIGASLVRRGEQWATERGKAGLWLVTHRAASWYERHFGYEAVATVQVKGVAKTVMARCFAHSHHATAPALPP